MDFFAKANVEFNSAKVEVNDYNLHRIRDEEEMAWEEYERLEREQFCELEEFCNYMAENVFYVIEQFNRIEQEAYRDYLNRGFPEEIEDTDEMSRSYLHYYRYEEWEQEKECPSYKLEELSCMRESNHYIDETLSWNIKFDKTWKMGDWYDIFRCFAY